MFSPALIAAWVALAAPVAHGSFTLECASAYGNAAGATDAAAAHITLGPETCKSVRRITMHDHASSQDLVFGLRTLLHEARHVGQYRDGWNFFDPTGGYEHDAECTALRELPGTARRLGYRGRIIDDAVWLVRYEIEHLETAPYGGKCPTGSGGETAGPTPARTPGATAGDEPAEPRHPRRGHARRP
jgi:hypothetical protein